MKRLLLFPFLFFYAIGTNGQPDQVFTTLNGTLNPGGNYTTYGTNLNTFYQIIPAGAATVKLVFTLTDFG